MISTQQAKEISIVEYLLVRGCEKKRTIGGQHFFLSPFRHEKDASFAVREGAGKDGEDLWRDYGLGGRDGGDIIELVKVWENCSFREALGHLENYYKGHNFRVQKKPGINPSLFHHSTNSIKVTAVRPLNHFILLQYLREDRYITEQIAKKYLKLVWYENKGKKDFFAFGWANEHGAYELRSRVGEKDFKAVTGKKGLTIIPHKEYSDTCFLFEGMLDYLSVLVLKNCYKLNGEVVILNSTSLKSRLIEYLQKQQYKTIYTLFDNDRSGEEAFLYLQSKYPHPDIRKQTFYSGHKDVNDYLIFKRK